MFDIERGFIGKQSLIPPAASLGQIADEWNPKVAETERRSAQKMLAAALQKLDAGETVPLTDFLGQTTGDQINEALKGR